MIKENNVYQGDAGVLLQKMPASTIPLTITSPPYGSLRTYGGHDFDFEAIAEQLYRVTAEGGVLVWVSGDMLIKGSETGLSFQQCLHLMKLGFNLHDTMIYCKQNPLPRNQRRYQQQFEYMFVFSKGSPKVFNPIKEPCKYAGVKSTGKYYEQPDTAIPYRASKKEKRIANEKIKGNIWCYWVGRDTAAEKDKNFERIYHPAIMPFQLALDHISTWSNEDDVVLDPMCGSGTTLLAAKKLNRRYIGIDICEEYVTLARDRLTK